MPIIQKLLTMEQTQSKFSISFKPPLPNIRTLPSPRSPGIPHSPTALPIKRTSNSKSNLRISAEKSRREIQIEKDIKYTKNVIQQAKNEMSLINSDSSELAKTARNKLEDTQATVQKVKSLSREKRPDSTWKRSEYIERTDPKMLDSVCGVSQSKNRRGSCQKNEDFYLYWKNKAHEYLESNMKLMDQISRLTKENQDLKEVVQKLKAKTPEKSKQTSKNSNIEQVVSDIRAMSLHYLKKIEEMEKELKRKEIIIISYQIKMKDINQAIVGQKQRTKIISVLKQEIFALKGENAGLMNQINEARMGIPQKGKQIFQQTSLSKLKTLK